MADTGQPSELIELAGPAVLPGYLQQTDALPVECLPNQVALLTMELAEHRRALMRLSLGLRETAARMERLADKVCPPMPPSLLG